MRLDPTLDALIRANLPGKKFGVFFSTGEGRFYPSGWEECSGIVVDESGQHYDYWTDWDAVTKAPYFSEWQRLDPREADAWAEHPEYLDARRAAGLVESER